MEAGDLHVAEHLERGTATDRLAREPPTVPRRSQARHPGIDVDHPGTVAADRIRYMNNG